MLTNSSRFKNALALFCLVGTGWACLATSSNDGSLYGTYHAKSDCVSPTYDNKIYVSASSITSPASTDFMTLGFPTANLNTGSDSTGTVNGVTRVCKIALNASQTLRSTYLYACSDNGQFSCNIYLEEQ